MVNPQPTDAYGLIVHDIQENILMRDFSAQQLKIIYLVIRLSWGCGVRAWQYETYKDFEVIGIYKTDVAKHLKFLDTNNVIEWAEKYKLLFFNKYYDKWTVPFKINSHQTIMNSLVHKSLKNTNEVRNLLTVLGKNNNCVSNLLTDVLGNSLPKNPENPIVPKVLDMPKESIKERIKTIDDFFEDLWRLYPKKEGKGQVSKTQKEKLYSIGYEKLKKCIELYIKAKQGTERKFLQNGSTFFNSGYVDYLNIEEEVKAERKPFVPKIIIKEFD